MFQVLLISAILCTASASFLAGGHHDQEQPQLSRVARQQGSVPGGVDFSGCVTDPETGLCCVEKEETVTSLEKEPILECTAESSLSVLLTVAEVGPPCRRGVLLPS